MAWHSAALLLGRPDEALIAQLESIHRASHLLPDEVGGPLRATVVHLERAPLPELRSEHAATFAARVLPYGDPAPRLSELLEQAACHTATGKALLHELRVELDLLRDALLADESGWAGAVAAVTATLDAGSLRSAE